MSSATKRKLLHIPADLHGTITSALNSVEPFERQWSLILEDLRGKKCSPEAYREAWKLLEDRWLAEHQTPMPLWWPDDSKIGDANVARWMNELGHANFDEFYQWSINKREAFWQASTERLEIRFLEAAKKVLVDEHDSQNAKWFQGARLNITESCFKADGNATAIKVQKPGEAVREISYRELERLTNQVANSFVAAGYKAGDAIAVVLPMTELSVALYLGIIRAGLVVVSIADSFAAPQIENRLRIANAKAVVTYDEMIRAGKSIPLYGRVSEASDIPIIVIPENGNDLAIEIRKRDLNWNNFLVDDSRTNIHAANSLDAINILFSSGTTGDPKAIPWNHLTPIKCATDGFIHQDIQPGHVVAWPTNLGWMMGPWLIFAALINRASIALYEDAPMGEGFGRFVQDAKVNMLGVVPTIVKHWRSTKSMEPFDWSNIHVFSSTGESSHPDDMFYLSSLAGMRPIIEYCGGTEIGGGYITSTVVQPNIASAFSTPTAGLGVCILDDEGHRANEGELFIVPPSVGLSDRLLNRDHQKTYYHDLPEPEGVKLRKHGDQFRKESNGYFVAGGRTDDTMNLGGIKVSSSEIERVLNRIHEIKETAAVAHCEQGGPEQLVVFYVIENSHVASEEPLLAEMNSLLKTELNPLFRIGKICRVESLPRTASNKVMRRLLRDQLEN